MATKPTDDEDDVLDLDTPIDDTDPDADGDDKPDPDDGDDDDTGDGDAPAIVTFDGEEPPADDGKADSSVIRRMRQELKEAKRELAEARKAAVPAKIELGEKPTLESCGYDGDLFETELEKFKERQAAVERQAAEQERTATAARQSWDEANARYQAKKVELGVDDFDEAQEAVDEALGVIAPVILKAANDPAAMVYGLGKSPAKLAEIAKIKDPFELAAAVARMEGAMKVVKARARPAIDRPAKGSASMPGDTDKELEKLEKEAARTGDRTKLIRYKKSKGLK